jgi:hypothetical protein
MTIKNSGLFALVLATGVSLPYVESVQGHAAEVTFDARSDCRIEYEGSGDLSTLLAYVRNTNSAQSVQVTVSVTEWTPQHGARRLPDQIHHLAPGQKEFCGGTVSFQSKYTYAIVGASYR